MAACSELYLDSNQLTSLAGLSHLSQSLTVLSVADNQLTSLSGIEHLTSLKKLNAARNLISDVVPRATGTGAGTGNSSGSASASTVSGSGGGVTVINGAALFEPLKNLEELNLSDNRLTRFATIAHWFKRLPALKILYLADSHYGENPVTALFNYHTFALYHLACTNRGPPIGAGESSVAAGGQQQLLVLDSIRLSDETLALADSTYLKKQV